MDIKLSPIILRAVMVYASQEKLTFEQGLECLVSEGMQ